MQGTAHGKMSVLDQICYVLLIREPIPDRRHSRKLYANRVVQNLDRHPVITFN